MREQLFTVRLCAVRPAVAQAVGFFCTYADWRLCKHNKAVRKAVNRLQPRSRTRRVHCPAVQAERHVRADQGRKLRKLAKRKRLTMDFIERKQYRRRVAAAARKPRFLWDLLVNGYGGALVLCISFKNSRAALYAVLRSSQGSALSEQVILIPGSLAGATVTVS